MYGFDSIAITTIEFEVQSETSIPFSSFPGVAIRAALYETFTQMYDTGPTVDAPDTEVNPLSLIFASKNTPGSGGHTIPHPYIIRPPLSKGDTQLTFGITLFGTAVTLTQHVISCVVGMQSLGLGNPRTPFTIEAVYELDALTGERKLLIDRNGKPVGTLIGWITWEEIQNATARLQGHAIQLTFLTPTAIIANRRLLKEPTFRPLFQRLLERTLLLFNHYTPTPIQAQIDELLTIADTIVCTRDDTRFHGKQQGRRYSRNIVGYFGEAQYSGEFSSLLPLLVVGSLLNVGKNTAKGCGWFKIERACPRKPLK